MNKIKGEKVLKVSIIIPVYNVEKYLRKCLDSVYSLDLSSKEIVIINDGSTDSSLDILNFYKSKYPNKTKIITQKNQGLSEARNVGLKNATGDYVLFVDSDDFIDPIVTEIFLNEAYKEKVDILIGDYIEYFSNNNLRKKKHYNLSNESSGLFFLEEGFKNKCFEVMAWKNIYRKNFLLENNLFFYKGLLHEDNLFTPLAFYYAKKVHYFKGSEFYYYRKNNQESITAKINEKNYSHLLFTIKKLIDFSIDNNINNTYFNRYIVGIYIQIILRGKYKNTKVFNQLLSLKYAFREKIKLYIIKLKSLRCKELKLAELEE